MNSRWQANKIGLINFWYYDEQEFSFVKGRMLLRGSNGSGKSVTMQSVVPLLLDGNMSPERLDPFGSRDRKMSSYLLEEDDEREERTGYLYLEFKRKESETYLTIGMGIRARKGKPLDKWYFSLTDGRRIGKDFLLYRETNERVTLSKRELENRIQSGGQVFERQADYMDYVRRQVFGFETMEEYREMLDLLIQLRTPKLSKDFKPSVINDILSDSLQSLSDDDLRPMSEAIENMDTMTLNLHSRQEEEQAAENISRVMDKYNRFSLYQKASAYEENTGKLKELRDGEQTRLREIEEYGDRIEELEQRKNALNAKKEAMEKERDSLSRSDAVSLKAREMELAAGMEEKRQQLEKKERQLEEKQERCTETEYQKKQEQNRLEQKEQELREYLEEMEAEAEEMAFQEHAFFEAELLEKLGQVFDFSSHKKQMEQTQNGISRGLKLLEKSDFLQEKTEEAFLEKEKHQREIDKAQHQVTELEGVLLQCENEWKEALYAWNGKNRELQLPGELLKEFCHFAESYGEKSDFAQVKKAVSDAWIERNGKVASAILRGRDNMTELETALREKEAELAEWQNHREPQPPRSEETIRNRERLQKLGIPYQEFYKMLEFAENFEKTDCDRLEEALLRMGILDALVVDEVYRDRILQTEEGCCDRYLFVQKERADRSLLDVLDLNDSVDDMFLHQRLTGILQNISYEGIGTTAVSPDGWYQLGALTGTVTGNYEAGFLGTQAREKHRLMKLAECAEAVSRLKERLAEESSAVQALEERKNTLAEEYNGFPLDTDLREALKMLSQGQQKAERLMEEGKRLEKRLLEASENLKKQKREALELAEKLYLPCSSEAFKRADDSARKYDRHFYQVKADHEIYLQAGNRIDELSELLLNLDADMDEIRYDIGEISKNLKKETEEYISVSEQLKLTDYEQMKERLDSCMKWLKTYPMELQSCVEAHTACIEQRKTALVRLEQDREKIQEYGLREKYLGVCFGEELALGYVALPEKLEKSAESIADYLKTDCERLDKESVIGALNESYFKYRGALNEYQLMQTEIFRELEETRPASCPPARRLDICAKYKGIKMSLAGLLSYLKEDILQLQELIKSGDRELFEDILSNTVSRKIRGKINGSDAWVAKMNALMAAMNTSSGLKLSLKWRSKTAESEDQLDTGELVELLKKDYRLMREEEAAKLSLHFRSKVQEARRNAKDSGGMISFYQVMKDALDYRKWFEFRLFCQKNGEKKKELTNSVFGTFSGGEKAMSMYVPLFSAVVAKYQGGSQDAPRLISLDEAFAGVDNKNIRDMFRLMTEFQFDFIINSQVLWGDCDTLDALAIYQLLRPGNAKFVTVMPYLWNGNAREMIENEEEMERKAAEWNQQGMS